MNFWKDRLAKSFVDLNPDVIGMQEVDTRIQDELPGRLAEHGAPEYDWYIFSPYSAAAGVERRLCRYLEQREAGP